LAVAFEEASEMVGFQRRVRIMAGNEVTPYGRFSFQPWFLSEGALSDHFKSDF
jgi:hypothetical protein